MKKIKLYNKASTGKIKVLEISVNGATLTTRWGYEGGTMQETSEKGKGKNLGKANEITPEQNARDLFDRKVKKKTDEGYVENPSTLDNANDPFTLPKQFSPSKPIQKMLSDKALQKLIDAKRCVASYKRDGHRAFIFFMPSGEVKIMSRKLEDYTEHLRHIATSIMTGAQVPPGSILDVEIVATPHEDDVDYTGSILRSKPDKARTKQSLGGNLYAYCFDVLYWDGEDITSHSYVKRHGHTALFHSKWIIPSKLITITSIKQLRTTFDAYTQHGGEGLVIYDSSAPTVIRYDGKVKRKSYWKMKAIFEDDFYVRGWEYGNGKNAEVVGALYIFQKDAKGNEIAVGKVGGMAGDSIIRRELLAEDLTGGTLVVQVEYSKRNKKGLRFPVLQRIRRDKTPEECIYKG
jgi:ATP-dependent DNA ligase